MVAPTEELLNRIPDVAEIAAKLLENQREAAILRSLMRVAKVKAKRRQSLSAHHAEHGSPVREVAHA